ncbi:hypothetical protein NB644_09325 [Oxalobacter formigenes]|nr:hypothetical protein [Oxalobacter formigenes]WAW01137.1 hypothetical protein NB644_09325 [Oxalobacter formigenes]WAW07522.1 hypothetical protein NB638_08295 [Oxalobacter formigenes]
MLDESIVNIRGMIENIEININDNKTEKYLADEIEKRREDLSKLRTTRDIKGSVLNNLEELLVSKYSDVKNVQKQIYSYQSRVNGIERIKNEIEVEIDTLNLNEESRKLFASFKDICSNIDCKLFTVSSESYAKNLLYLKDQIKDLESNSHFINEKIKELSNFLNNIQSNISELEEQIRNIELRDDIKSLVDVIGRLTEEIFELERERKSIEVVNKYKTSYFNKIVERDKILDLIGSMSANVGVSDIEYTKIRLKFKEFIIKWLDILGTKNISRDIIVENDLKIIFGKEKINSIKGSTKVRVILAVRAAFFELYLNDKNRQFRFLILDTPRQHEIHEEDINNFMINLKNLASDKDAQIIFSSTSYHYNIDNNDEKWEPAFNRDNTSMYLGNLN